jgi:hypothetical protein
MKPVNSYVLEQIKAEHEYKRKLAQIQYETHEERNAKKQSDKRKRIIEDIINDDTNEL